MEVTQHVILNVGHAEGVLPKMDFYVRQPRAEARFVVIKVAELESKAVATFTHEKGVNGIAPSTDWELTTPRRQAYR